MATVYDWSPLFQAVNGAITKYGERNQYNNLINSLSGTPGTAATPETPTASTPLSLPGGGTTMLNGSVPALPATPGTPGPLSGVSPQILQALRNAPPHVGLPLLLQLGTQQHKYSQTPQYDQQGRAFVTDDQGNVKYLDGISARDKVEFQNGQAVDPYKTPVGTIIPKQNDPNKPFNADGTPNKAFQGYEKGKIASQQAPQWANIDLAKQRLAAVQAGVIDPDSIGMMADQVLAGDKSPFQNLGRGAQGSENIAALRKEVMTRAKARGLGGADLASLNAEFAGLTAGERTLGNRTANIEMAASEAQNLMPIALAASKAVSRTQYPTLNKLQLAIQQGTGDENVVKLGVAVNGLVNTYARAISPTGNPTVSDKDHAREILDKAWSNGQFEAAVGQMQQEIAAARKSPGSVRGEFRNAISGHQGGYAAVPDAPGAGVPATSGGWSIKLKGQ